MSRNISEWLQKNALEQLAEISSCLYKFLLCSPRIISQNALVIDLILKILISAQNISLKRKIFQPHFTIAVDGLFHVYEAVNLSENSNLIPNLQLGLRAILMSSPPPHIISMVYLPLQGRHNQYFCRCSALKCKLWLLFLLILQSFSCQSWRMRLIIYNFNSIEKTPHNLCLGYIWSLCLLYLRLKVTLCSLHFWLV